jgi:putative Mg2+ transporter-C (MgtC) family protein
MDWHVELRLTIDLVIAALLGAIIGLERERHVGLAGIRTHAAVALGACLFGFISFNITGPSDPNRVVGLADPSRIAAQIVSGIGFLGAGVILRDRGRIRGLTTAASVWATASIGLGIANKMYILSVASTVIILLLLSLYRLPGWYKWTRKHQRQSLNEDD